MVKEFALVVESPTAHMAEVMICNKIDRAGVAGAIGSSKFDWTEASSSEFEPNGSIVGVDFLGRIVG